MDWKNKNILLVEDDEVSSILLNELLEESNANLFFAKNGKEAIAIFNQIPTIHLVLMDLQLPEMDGFEALEHLRKQDPNVPVLAQTAFYSLDMKKKCLNAGFNDFLAKPLSIDKLSEKISPYLNK